MNVKKLTRFSGSLVEDYKALRLAWPHRFDLYNRMSEYALADRRLITDEKPVRILDAGCGDCEALEILVKNATAQDLQDRLVIDAIDISPVMIAEAKKRFADYKLATPVTLHEQDLTAYLESKPTGSYDIVTSGWTIHNFSNEKRTRTVTEIGRVLSEHGQFIWMDKIFPDIFDDDAVKLVGANFTRYLDTGLVSHPKFKTFITHEFNDIADAQRLEHAEVEQLLSDAGFKSFAFDGNFYRADHGFDKIYCANK